MFFYLFEHLNKYIKTPFIFATVAYILLNGYLKNTVNLFFWSVFIVDVILTYYKKNLLDIFDSSIKKPEDEPKEVKTTKSGYFDIDLDFMSTSKSSNDRSTIDKLVQDSKSL